MRERGAESNVKLPHIFIASKIAILLPGHAVEYLPFSRTLDDADDDVIIKH